VSSSKKLLIFASAAIVIAVVAVIGLYLVATPPAVPNLYTMPIDQATTTLQSAGLSVGKTSQVATTAVGADRVAVQSPAPLSRVRRGSSVDVTVAVAPVESSIPDVLGQPLSAAEKTLSDALYQPTPVDVFESSGTVGSVVGQIPLADTTWLTGRPVAIAVSAGPDDGTGVKVPDIVGMRLDKARAELAKIGLTYSGGVVNINDPAANVITNQLPRGGLVVRPGTTVLILAAAP
jgi:serine/threonine-protein kinase